MSVAAAAQAPLSIHATGVIIGESGLIIRGPSGSGKSSLALALLAAAEQGAYFGALIGDDRLLLSAHHGRLVVRGHPLIRGLIEQRGRGILKIGAEPDAVVRLVVDIIPIDQASRLPEVNPSYVKLCGIELPLLALPKAGGADDLALAVLTWLRQFGAI